MKSDASVWSDAEVMAAIDDAGAETRLVIADVSRDEAWLAVETADARSLPDWR